MTTYRVQAENKEQAKIIAQHRNPTMKAGDVEVLRPATTRTVGDYRVTLKPKGVPQHNMIVRPIEIEAKKIMSMNEEQLRKNYKGKRLPVLYYYILEDANFHRENNILSDMGVFGEKVVRHYDSGDVISPKKYGSDEVERQYKEYRAKGGRTWEL